MSHPINFDLQIAEHEEKITELKKQRATYLALPMWYVIGGEYIDTTFTTLKDKEEKYGPFEDWQDACYVWRAKSWSNVDSCLTRYKIEEA